MGIITIDLGSLTYRDIVYYVTGTVCVVFEDSDGDIIYFKLNRSDHTAVLSMLRACIDDLRSR